MVASLFMLFAFLKKEIVSLYNIIDRNIQRDQNYFERLSLPCWLSQTSF